MVDTLLHFPGPERCGAYLEVGPSTSHPLSEMEIILQAKHFNDPTMGRDGHKYLLRIELKAKGETEMEARNVKINVGFSQSVTGLKTSLKIQLGITENKFLGLKNSVFCVLVSSEYSPSLAEVEEIRTETEHEENTVKGSASLRYGNGNSCRNIPTLTNVVYEQSTHVDSEQILTQNYSMALDLYKSPPLVRSLMDKLTTLFKVANLGHDTTKLDVIKMGDVTATIMDPRREQWNQFNRSNEIKNMLAILVRLRKFTFKKLRIKRKQKSKLGKQGVTCEGNQDDESWGTRAGIRILPEDHSHQPSSSQTSLQDLIAIAQKEIFSEKHEEDAYLEFDSDSCYSSGTESDGDIYEDMAFNNFNNNDLYMTMVFLPPSIDVN